MFSIRIFRQVFGFLLLLLQFLTHFQASFSFMLGWTEIVYPNQVESKAAVLQPQICSKDVGGGGWKAVA